MTRKSTAERNARTNRTA